MVSHIKERIQSRCSRYLDLCGRSKRRLENIHNEEVYDFLRPIKRYYDFQITEDEMHGARTRKRRNVKVLVGSAEGKEPL